MPFLPLGRLFWKFLIFFFLAQTTAVLGIGLAIWASKPDHGQWPPPPPAFEAQQPGGPFDKTAPPEPRSFAPDPARMPPQPGPKPPLFHLITGAVVSLIFAALLATYIARPIQRLRAALQAGASGRLTPGLAATMGNRRDELTDLCHDFDGMAQHLAQLMEGQRRLLHDVSHELRSPLARLNAIIGLARQQPESLADYLARLEHESVRMDRLLSELLTLSRLESGMVEPCAEVVDLGELLGDVVEDAAPETEQAGCQVTLEVPSAAFVRGDPELLHRMFDNLLRNALAHAASGKWVGISLTANESEISVQVEDCGPGVLSTELDRLFIPFYRGSKTAGGSGHGLGLALARQIVENHHGRIEAANRAERGLCLTVTLPRVPDPEPGFTTSCD